jgi:AraC-like DNA-binding protein
MRYLRDLSFYLDPVFEDLSHFSFTFKKKYGISPSDILKLNVNK